MDLLTNKTIKRGNKINIITRCINIEEQGVWDWKTPALTLLMVPVEILALQRYEMARILTMFFFISNSNHVTAV